LSWYVCGLDWIAALRDPVDPTRPLIESVNMSVTKWGQDDPECGATIDDVLHMAICRVVAKGITVVAAAANDSSSAAARVPAAYNEVITVSALADTDGKPGALGGPRCYSWGSYDDDDSFANFSNYGSDVDIIAPGKCIWSTVPGGFGYMSGTSMAAPHVSGAVALLKTIRPSLTPAEVKKGLQDLGTLNWKITSDPDPYHEKLLDVSRIAPRGVSVIGADGG
jgi:subtilisin family serine protease